jgi:hypothetical protein
MMMRMFSHTKKPSFGLVLVIAFLCIWIIHPDTASAQAVGSALPTGLESDIAAIVSKLISMMNILTWILFIFLNFVLDPQFIFDLDKGGSFMNMLNQIWQLSRDLMNIVFALVLVGTAVYTIVTANKEFVTSHAKKFIMAVVLVNFSWFVPLFIIDVANVAAATIYGIPSLLFDNSSAVKSCSYESSEDEYPGTNGCTLVSGTPAGKDEKFTCKCHAIVNADIFMSKDDRLAHEAQKSDGWSCQGDIICVQSKPWDAKILSGHSAILNGLILNHAHLQTMAMVPGPINSDDIGEMTRFLLVEGIILIIHVAMFFPLLAMFVAFLIRIPILWLTMAFMPFFFLSWVIEGNEYADMTKRIGEQFLKAAFLPAVVAVPLSVGFILVNAGDQLDASPISAIKIRLIDGISDYWELLWWLMTLGVLWVGTFTVLEKAGGLYAKTAKVIQNYGESWGRIAMKAPLSVPLPGMSMSPLMMLKAVHPRMIEASLSEKEGILGHTKKILAGTVTTDPASHLAKDENKRELDTLHTDLVTLEQIMRSGNAVETKKQLDKIQTERGVDLHGNTGQKLEDFLKNLNTKGVDTKKAGVAGNKDLEAVKDSIKTI